MYLCIFMLINVNKQSNGGFQTFISMINFMLSCVEQEKVLLTQGLYWEGNE